MHKDHLIILADVYSRHQKRAAATISNRIVGHARLFSRLKAGHGTTIRTYERALSWFDRNWPDGLDWPSSVPRPKRLKGAA